MFKHRKNQRLLQATDMFLITTQISAESYVHCISNLREKKIETRQTGHKTDKKYGLSKNSKIHPVEHQMPLALRRTIH